MTRKIYTKVVIDISTGETLYEESFLYDGPIAECKQKKTTTSERARVLEPQWTIPHREAAFEALSKLAFPEEWYAEQMLPGLEGLQGLLKTWAEKGIYDPEQMRQLYTQAMAPGVDIATKGLMKMLAGQWAAGKISPATFLSRAGKEKAKLGAEAWGKVPELMAQQVGVQQQLPETWANLLKGRMAPQEFEFKKAQSQLAGIQPYLGQYTKGYTKEPESGLFNLGLFGIL